MSELKKTDSRKLRDKHGIHLFKEKYKPHEVLNFKFFI